MYDEVDAALDDFRASTTGPMKWRELRWMYQIGVEIIGLSLLLPSQQELVEYLGGVGRQCMTTNCWETLIELLLEHKDSKNAGAR
ncbi:hypothetical protein ONS95_006825 [Cadophora gregata]|uniref:uncharacterized protein n=1 Tax=Cadophora gregata TaxID=51156 RepID=UPI0026DAB5CD|nr:uncharacterized protein ONS95_006825 [Cadophora gregata]KAK0101667.1 hypothetical protein ONS95_006825 [Cadophora gregata]KAK0106316.1 hypothetical protein ONS96_003954 [Cadophora gregata f. sp. sojae]